MIPPPRRRTVPAAFLPLLAILSQGPAVAVAEDLSFVSDEELDGEIAARQADLERTRARVQAIEADLDAAREELEGARRAAGEIESHLVARASLLYRLTRHGAALRFLLGPGSGTASLRRIGTLERLVRESLERRREIGLHLARTEERIETASEQLATARRLESGLEAAREELEAERARRKSC
jgi:chromosome segregation ATPase